jgi:hypothetical protein
MSQHYNYASSTNSPGHNPSTPQPNSSSMIMTDTRAPSSSAMPSMNPTQNSHLSSSNYGSSPYDSLSSPSNTPSGTGNVYPPSYYRQSSVPSYPNSLPQQQQQLARQMSSNYPMTPAVSSTSITSNVNSSSSSSPAPPFR